MNSQQLLDEILGILRVVKDDKDSLERILTYLYEDIIIPDESEPEIPERFKDVVKEIAGSIDAGFVCYLNMDTLEIEDLHQDWIDEDYDLELETGVSADELDCFKHREWENCMEFEPLESNESFRIMADFASQLKNIPLQNKLVNALNNRKPFANFKNIIDNSGEERQQWFDFKQEQLENHIKNLLLAHLPNEDN